MEECHDVRLDGLLVGRLVGRFQDWWEFHFYNRKKRKGENESKVTTISLTIKWQIGLDFHLPRQLFFFLFHMIPCYAMWYDCKFKAICQQTNQPPNSLMCCSSSGGFCPVSFTFRHDSHFRSRHLLRLKRKSEQSLSFILFITSSSS